MEPGLGESLLFFLFLSRDLSLDFDLDFDFSTDLDLDLDLDFYFYLILVGSWGGCSRSEEELLYWLLIRLHVYPIVPYSMK